MLVFVYGTLKRGERNHSFLRNATFVSDARTVDRFSLLDLGSFPAMVRHPAETQVSGEIYQIDANILERLDRLEGVPTLYDMHRIRVTELDSGEEIDVMVYLFAAGNCYRWPTVKDGNWTTRKAGV
jgi:gamma-glutamylcyclotransferase (GGCT)/AIG2-like uncharacterized protein YtfP